MDMIYVGERRGDFKEDDQRSTWGLHPPLHCFVNDERTRSFLAIPIGSGMAMATAAGGDDCLKRLRVNRPPRHLLKMIGAVNKVFVMHGLQVYYKVRSC